MNEKQKERKALKAKQTQEMFNMFREIWDEREDEEGYCYCFETGRRLHRSVYRENSMVYDHVLPKSKYPEYRMVKKNVVILAPDVHVRKTGDVKKTPKVCAYQEKLLALHEQNKLGDI